MAKTNIGRVSVVPKGEYSSTEDYKRLDVVSSDGSMYMSKKDNNIGNPLNDENWWFKAVSKGEVGPQGEKPINGVDYNTDEEKEEFKNDVVSKATEEVEKNVADIENEAIENYNKNATQKTTEYNTNANTQVESFNANATSKTNDFNSNASTKTEEFNTNYEEKLESINEASTSIEQEREISDNKYARALKKEVSETDFTQVFAENEKIEGLEIYGEELTQETREGYNELDINSLSTLTKNGVTWTINGDGSISVSGTCVNYESNVTLKAGKLDVGEYTYKCFGLPSTCKTNIWDVGDVTGEGIRRFTAKEGVDHNVVVVVPIGETVNFTIKPMLLKGSYTNDTLPPFEQYGAMPSLDYPSEVEITKEQKISIFRKNILDTNNINALGKIVVSSKPDGGLNVSGVAATNYKTLSTINLDIPIKAGTSLFSSFGKTLDLLKDNTDITPYFWLYNKNGTNFYTIRRSSNVVLTQDVYKIGWGIENLIPEKEYNEDMYIELEISDKRPTQFEKYEATEISVVLENNAIKEYADNIDRENKVHNKVIQELTLTGAEEILESSRNNLFYIQLDNIVYTSNVNTKSGLVISNCFKNESYADLRNYVKNYGIEVYLNRIYFRILDFNTVEEVKNKLKELYDAGTPVKVYYVAETPTTNPLSEEVQTALSNFKLYQDLNNVAIDGGSMSFIYNKSLLRALEEQSELSANLLERVQALEQAQVSQVGGN